LSPKRNKKKEKSTGFFWIKLGLKLLGAGVLFFSLFIFLVWAGFFGRLPSKEDLSEIQQNTASEVFSSDGKSMGRYFIDNRLTIDNQNISPNVTYALISTEDSRFFEHRGIDFISLGRVVFKTILLGNHAQGGGSTISEQLARNLFPRKGNRWSQLLINKTKEAIIASRLEKSYKKEEVLNLYLNTVPFGEDLYGIETAAKRFFGKNAGALNPAEAATLIGMLAANTAYNPRLHPDRSKERRNVVLHRMEKQDYLSPRESKTWQESPLNLHYRKIDQNTGIAPYFRDYLRIRLESLLKHELGDSINLLTDGLKIYTTLDSQLQSYAEKAVQLQMRRLQEEFNQHWKNRTPWTDTSGFYINTVKESKRYQQLLSQGYNEKECLQKMQQPVLATGGEKIKKSPLDSIRHELLTLHTGFLAIDPVTGHILAWVGGKDHGRYQYDHVTSRRQVGSTFKPIVYAAALENGMKPCEFISNEKKVYTEFDNWSPANADEKYEGYYSLKGGLAHSVNSISVKVLMKTGIQRSIWLAKKMGLTGDIPSVPSIALGSAEFSLLEMLEAYSTFLNQGIPKTPFGILRIEDKDGNTIYQTPSFPKNKPVIKTETALLMTSMLREVVDSGTAQSLHSLFHLRSQLGGKTGTTQNNADGWFIGFTPNLLAGCWVGADNPAVHFRTIEKGQGAYTALPVFAYFIKQLEQSQQLNKYTGGSFPLLPSYLKDELNCPDYSLTNPQMSFFKKILNLWPRNDSIQIKRKEERIEKRNARREENKKNNVGFMNKLRKLFNTKNDTTK